MKIRLAKKITKYFRELDTKSAYIILKEYWQIRCFCYGCNITDHRITKAISLTNKKKKYEQKEEISK